jgi:hypothetical protein
MENYLQKGLSDLRKLVSDVECEDDLSSSPNAREVLAPAIRNAWWRAGSDYRLFPSVIERLITPWFCVVIGEDLCDTPSFLSHSS